MNRPSRSQQTLLDYIEQFITQHGYGPSYREIMKALDYKSVSTVAIHIDGLIAKGKLKKHGRSARSLEVVSDKQSATPTAEPNEAWLVKKIETYAASPDATQEALGQMAENFHALGLKTAAEKAKSYVAK